jgi:hypothetical protein
LTYRRVIPRDLFNEGDLLKCYGQLYLELEKLRMEDCLEHHADDGPFRIRQCEADGSLSIGNVILVVRGMQVQLSRPLNARAKYPLWASVDGTEYRVFDVDGKLSDEFREFLRA